MKKSKTAYHGFSIVEVILAMAIFMLFATGAITLVVSGLQLNKTGLEESVATQFATEGLEAVRSIKNQSYASLTTTPGTGIVKSGQTWAFGGSNNTLIHNSSDSYTRVLTVENVQRDCSGNIVTSGGTIDTLTKKITSTVSWRPTPSQNKSLSLITYLSNWKTPITATLGGGIVVYGDSSPAPDAIKYKVLNQTTGIWSAEGQALDVDSTSTTRIFGVIVPSE